MVVLSVTPGTISEASGATTFTATLSALAGLPVTVTLGFMGSAAHPADYTRSATQIVIPPGSPSADIAVTAVPDALHELSETIVVEITGVTNGEAGSIRQATATLVDDDQPPIVTLDVDHSTIREAGGVARVTATLSAPAGVPVTVALGYNGTATHLADYTRSATQFVIPAGSLSGSVIVTAVQDMLYEGDETVIVDIMDVTSGEEAAVQAAAITIQDDDSPPTVTLAVDKSQISEGLEVARVTATLSGMAGLPVTIDLGFGGTASGGTDYTPSSAQIVIPPGTPSGGITVAALLDGTIEPQETIVVEMTSIENGVAATPQQATITILDAKPWTNPRDRRDVNPNGFVVSNDALVVINEVNFPTLLNEFGRLPPMRSDGQFFYDVNADGFCTSQDVLLIINFLNEEELPEGEGPATAEPLLAAAPALLQLAAWPDRVRNDRPAPSAPPRPDWPSADSPVPPQPSAPVGTACSLAGREPALDERILDLLFADDEFSTRILYQVEETLRR
jgi:hypothetical protein